MRGDEPEGGQWNLTRKTANACRQQSRFPHIPSFNPMPKRKRFWTLLSPALPAIPVLSVVYNAGDTRDQALEVLDRFVEERLPLFGKYQDAMKQGEPKLFHSMVSAALIADCSNRWKSSAVPNMPIIQTCALECSRGIHPPDPGWREYVAVFYWLKMPTMRRPMRSMLRARCQFLLDCETDMNCLRQSHGETLENAHAHHIQRLMVTEISHCWQAFRRRRSRNGIWQSMPMLMNGWSFQIHMEWSCLPMAAISPQSPTRLPAPTSTACLIIAAIAATR